MTPDDERSAAEHERRAQENACIRLALLVPSRTTWRQPKGGVRTEDLLDPTLRQLARHAEAFGTECVLGVGEAKLNRKDLARLRIELDAVDAGRPRRRFAKSPPRRRRSPPDTRAACVALVEDGLVPLAVANRLGISVKTVRAHLRAAK